MKEDRTPKAPRRRGDAGIKSTQMGKVRRCLKSSGPKGLRLFLKHSKDNLQPGVLMYDNKLLEEVAIRIIPGSQS